MRKIIDTIREKPLHVRERILLVSMAVITPVLITVWYSTFQFTDSGSGPSAVDSMKATVLNASNDSAFKQTFPLPSFSTNPKPVILQPQATTDAQNSGVTTDAPQNDGSDQASTQNTQGGQ